MKTETEAVRECRDDISVAKTNGDQIRALERLFRAGQERGYREGYDQSMRDEGYPEDRIHLS